MNLLIIGLGGALGAVLRYLSTMAAIRLFGPGFPWGTAFVNVAGSLVMGVVAVLLIEASVLRPQLALFAMTGVLGGFTTFSAFSLDAAQLIEAGRMGEATAYVVGSAGLAIAGLFIGLAIGRMLT
ncbi:fluoride efflux transporter CrcB [Pikeienuella piscinae]|uniref:Fluoride-specific ion channel FluC n=1 Tax=Pikeienuella piscinae TaxID=2748098 RepID=A0A7M3T6H6_9RHOB|nr:fluoride efflux transporter CrcB [Pikeienuella piscinae]QIE57607.1 fluoride efflux transporter CrcB [Pikeienuella piscinae]